MCESEWLSSIVFSMISLVLFLVGIPSWIVGSLRPQYYSMKALRTIPIYPQTDDRFTYWVGVNSTDTSVLMPYSEFYPISFRFDTNDFEKPGIASDFYLIHNLFGYNISLSVIDAKNNIILVKRLELNSIIGKYDLENVSLKQPYLLPLELRSSGDFRVHCPYPTLVTDLKGIGHKCQSNVGYIMPIEDQISLIDLGKIDLNEDNFPITISFSSMKVLTRDFIHTPMIFLTSWEESDSIELVSAGVLMTSVGFVSLVISVSIYVFYLFSLS